MGLQGCKDCAWAAAMGGGHRPVVDVKRRERLAEYGEEGGRGGVGALERLDGLVAPRVLIEDLALELEGRRGDRTTSMPDVPPE